MTTSEVARPARRWQPLDPVILEQLHEASPRDDQIDGPYVTERQSKNVAQVRAVDNPIEVDLETQSIDVEAQGTLH